MDKLPKGWCSKQISNIAFIRGGKRIPKGYNLQEEKTEFPYIRVTDFNDNGSIDLHNLKFITKEIKDQISKYTISSNDVYISIAGTIGKTGIIPKELDGSNLTENAAKLVFKNNDQINKWFILYFTQTTDFKDQAGLATRVVAMPKLALSRLSDIQIPFPPVSEQNSIVNKLVILFDRIDKSIVLVEENIKHTKALMASVLEDVFGGGNIPLANLCIINPKKSEIKDFDNDTEVSFLPMTDLKVHQMHFEIKQVKKLNEVNTGYTYFRENDVLIAKVTPCFENGKAGIACNLMNSIGFGSTEYHVIRTKGNVLPEWIYYSVMTAKLREEGVNNMTGSSGLKRVPAKFIETWKIKQPSIEVQKKIIQVIQNMDGKLKATISLQQSKLTYLKALKSSLLDRAFKGEL